MFQGLITGTLGYELKRDFLANAIHYREVQTFNYEIYAMDFENKSASYIQSLIQNQFAQVYSGDIHVKVFSVVGSYQYPNDSLRAAKYNVTVEIKTPLSATTLNNQNPELAGSYYQGLDSTFFSTYAPYLLDFKEDFVFTNNPNGNREFNHSISFGIKTGFASDNGTAAGRKSYAQTIASGIFSKDQFTQLGMMIPSGAIQFVADPTQYRNYYNESYDLIRNTYSFSRRREQLPFTGQNTMFNLTHSLNMGENGIIEVSENATAIGKINLSDSKNDLNNFFSGLSPYSSSAYSRCTGFYNQFYNTNILAQDSQYQGNLPSSYLPLINTPTKLIRSFDNQSLGLRYDVSYTNNPQFSGDATMTSQTIDFRINEFNQVEATQTFDYTINRIVNDSGYITGLLNNTTGNNLATVSGYYTQLYPAIQSIYPKFNLLKYSVSAPNIKTKYSASFSYSNSPIYFVTTNGMKFSILDYTVENKTPNDIINEYKVINRNTKNNKSVLSYGYQMEKGQMVIKINAHIGKNSNCFYPDGGGSFKYLDADNYQLIDYLTALYKFGGQVFLAQFNFPTQAFNWFIGDSNYSIDSEGVLSVELNYIYTLKKRNYPNYP